MLATASEWPLQQEVMHAVEDARNDQRSRSMPVSPRGERVSVVKSLDDIHHRGSVEAMGFHSSMPLRRSGGGLSSSNSVAHMLSVPALSLVKNVSKSPGRLKLTDSLSLSLSLLMLTIYCNQWSCQWSQRPHLRWSCSNEWATLC